MSWQGAWTNQAQNLIILTETVGEFSGIFGYSPTPGFGNLVYSNSVTSGTEPYGNPYAAGEWVYSNSAATAAGLVPGGSTASYLALAAGGTTPNPPVNTAAIYGSASGGLQVVDAVDNTTYTIETRRIVLQANTEVSWTS